MTIGERIKKRRELLGLSQDELAKRIGYKSRSSINKIELNLCNLRQTKIKKIAEALSCSPAYIMGWEDLLITTNDKRLLRIESDFKTLNDKGKDEAVKRVDELTQIPDYTEPQLELLAAHERDDSRKEKGISAEDEKRQIINRQLNKVRETPIE